MKKYTEIMMNPVRQRIFICLAKCGEGSTAEICEKLGDVPLPTLYRHLKLMLGAGCIKVAEERAVRGTVLKIYKPCEYNPDDGFMPSLSAGFADIYTRFGRFFENPDADPMSEMLCFRSSAFYASDEEYTELMKKIAEFTNEYHDKQKTEERKLRQLVWISVPTDTEVK